MGDEFASSTNSKRHWDDIYAQRRSDQVSWYESTATASLELVQSLGVERTEAVIDVGGGASHFADGLLARSYADVTVLDISTHALAYTKRRLGSKVTYLVADVLEFSPHKTYDLWHDRAVFHFLAENEITQYRAVLEGVVAPGGAVILGTFGLDGPTQCSGLEVTRYDPASLMGALGEGFELVATRELDHVTPAETVQAFTWIAARRIGH